MHFHTRNPDDQGPASPWRSHLNPWQSHLDPWQSHLGPWRGHQNPWPIHRSVVFLVIALGLVAASTTATIAATVTVYSPHGKELLSLCESDFEAAHPNVDVRWLDMGSQEILDRLRAEAKRPQADVWFGAPATMFMTAANESLLEAYQPSWSGAAGEDRRDREHRWYGTFLTPEVILYNKANVTHAEIPDSFEGLADPVFKDRVILREPLASGTMRTIFGALILNAETEASGLATLARLDEVTVSYAANPTMLFQSLARGRGDITVWNLPDAMLQIDKYGFPFEFKVPPLGTPVLVDGIALIAGRDDETKPNGIAARAFYEFVTSPEMAAKMAHEFYRIPVRSDLDPATLPDWVGIPIVAMDMQWERLASEGPGWMNVFDRQIKGRGAKYLREQGH